MDQHLLELYSDYLLSSFGATTATGLSALVGGAIIHDQVTRFLARADYTAQTLWQHIKPLVRVMEQDDGVLIMDDTIQEKPHTDESCNVLEHQPVQGWIEGLDFPPSCCSGRSLQTKTVAPARCI